MSRPTPKRSLLHLTLAGLQELSMFRTEQDRDRAIAEFGESLAGNGRGLIAGIVVVAVSVAGFVFAVRVIVSQFTQRMWVRDVAFVVALVGMFLLLRWLHQRGAARHLRKHLVDSGVPVCIDCGYRLDGLPSSADVCPECGGALSDTIRGTLKLLSTARQDANPQR